MKNQPSQSGFSLLEVLVFVTILGLFFFSAISVSIFALKNMRVSEQRIMAAKYAEEMTEFLLSEKETDWNTFVNTVTTITTNKGGCQIFNSLDITWDSGLLCNAKIYSSELGIFTRKVTFTVTQTQVSANVTVEWREGRATYSVPINTVYTQ